MITCRQVYQVESRGLVGVAGHARAELAVVDAILPLIKEHPGHRRSWLHHLAHFLVFEESRTAGEGIRVAAVEPAQHRNTTHPWQYLAIGTHNRFVCRTFPDPRTIPTIRPQKALFQVLVDIPIACFRSEIQVSGDPNRLVLGSPDAAPG